MKMKKVLLIIDGSFLSFVVNFRAFKTWREQYQGMDTCIIRPPEETDQDNLPDLVNESKWFKKCLHNAAVDKLNSIANIIENSTGMLYPQSSCIDTIIAKDSKLTKSFRYALYPEYKLTRKLTRAKKGQYKIGPVFDELLANVFPSIFGDRMIQLAVDGAEGDDVIASIVKSDRVAQDYEKIILISSDRDFVQLQIDRPVIQYGARGEMVLPVLKHKNDIIELTPKQALMIKIISGDSSDNIKPIKPRIGEIRAYKYITEETDKFKRMLKEEPETAQRLILNSKLIDFRNIPSKLSESIVDEFYKLKNW